MRRKIFIVAVLVAMVCMALAGRIINDRANSVVQTDRATGVVYPWEGAK